jgi:ankyrin repeat protein
MWCAAYAGRGSAVARLLQQNDLEIDVPDTFHGSTPFALAVANGHVDIAEALLDTNKVNINFRDREGRTPLHHAVLLKHKSLVLLLLSRKEIDIQIRDETNCTPLWCAAECGNLDAARLLLMYGANPNIRDFHGITPLDNAISQRDTPMVELLLNQHNLEIPSHVCLEKRAQPPLCAAVCIGDADILRMLLCHVAEVNAYNYHGYQPLLLAVRKGDSSMVKLLLSHKDIDVNKRGGGRYGFTALHQAAYDGCLSILNMLLAHPGIDINAKDEWGMTLLWWATKNGHCLVVKRLLAESTLELDGFIELLLPLHHCR